MSSSDILERPDVREGDTGSANEVFHYVRKNKIAESAVMGTMVEQSFVTSLIKSDGSILPFFERPVSAILATMAIGALIWPVLLWGWRQATRSKAVARPAPAGK